MTFLAALRHDLEWAPGSLIFMHVIKNHLQPHDYRLILQLHGLSLIGKLVRPRRDDVQKDASGNLPPSRTPHAEASGADCGTPGA